MSRVRVFLTHGPLALAHYYGARALGELEALADVRRSTHEIAWTPETLADAASGCEIVVSDRRVEAGAPLLTRLPELVAFVRCAVDIRNVDVGHASAAGILVTQASAGFMASVAEWIVGVTIDLSRGISSAVQRYRSGATAAAAMGRELRGSTVGIVGFGRIARYYADIALALGMRVVVSDPYVRVERAELQQLDFTALLGTADIVVCLAAATPQTEKLFDDAAFAAMKRGALFVNASRGNLVDEPALLRALDGGGLAGAALDVGRAADQMPSPQLARHPLVVATPHIGGLTPAAIEHQALETVQQVRELLAGRVPAGAVNAARADRLAAFFARRAAARAT